MRNDCTQHYYALDIDLIYWNALTSRIGIQLVRANNSKQVFRCFSFVILFKNEIETPLFKIW